MPAIRESARPVHAPLNLLGWTTLALAGLVHAVYPHAAATRCARVHFWLYVWLYVTALPVMMLAPTGLLLGHAGALPVLVVAEFAIFGGVLAFALNVFLNLAPHRSVQTGQAQATGVGCLPAAGRAGRSPGPPADAGRRRCAPPLPGWPDRLTSSAARRAAARPADRRARATR